VADSLHTNPDPAPQQLSLFDGANGTPEAPSLLPPSPQARVAEALPAYERWLIGAGKAPQTVSNFLSDLRQLCAFAPRQELRQFTTAALESFLGYQRRDRGLAEKSVVRKITTLKSFFGFLLEHGVLSDDPARRLLYPSVPPGLPDILSDEEVQRLLQAAHERPQWHALIATLRYSGAKREEALALQRSDVDLDGPIPLLALRKRRPSRYGRDRAVPLEEPLRTILRRYLDALEGPYLFPLHVRSVAWGLTHYAERVGIARPVTAQTLRDTFAVAWLRQRLSSERELRRAGLAAAERELRARHDRELLDLLGLADRTAAVAVTKYRALAEPVGGPA
jgi:site-specific recombinase XerD